MPAAPPAGPNSFSGGPVDQAAALLREQVAYPSVRRHLIDEHGQHLCAQLRHHPVEQARHQPRDRVVDAGLDGGDQFGAAGRHGGAPALPDAAHLRLDERCARQPGRRTYRTDGGARGWAG